MELGLYSKLKQTQDLILTPILQQSLKILQYSSPELQEYIQKEMEANPLIEFESTENLYLDAPHKTLEPVDWKEFFKSVDYKDHSNTTYQGDYDLNNENRIHYETSLHEHLFHQVELLAISPSDKKIARFIIENIDDNGYLTISKHEIAMKLNINKEAASRLLRLVQTLEPLGVGARSLRECLLIQLKQMGKLTETMKAVVLEHLGDIAQNRYQIISKKLNIDMDEVVQICNVIKTLEPKPGRGFAKSDQILYITPDIEIKKVSETYEVIIRESAAPRLHISDFYRSILENSAPDAEESKYLTEKLQTVLNIMKAIEQRKETLRKVVSAIVEHQREFLDNGVLYLKPLTLKKIAEEIEMHESTVSRAISGKYALTPRGTFPLKYFFSTKMNSSEGEDVSTEQIKKILRDLVAAENTQRPLSDEKLCKLLEEKGIEISRRTVAKYRDQLGIPSSSKRRTFS